MSALAPLTGMPVAFKLGTALGVFLLPLLVYALLPPDAPGLPGPAPRRRRRARLPVRGGQPDLGRHDREHAHRGVLVHLRRRLRRPLPGRSLPGPRRRPRALGPGRRARADQLRARLRRAVGGPHGLGPSPVGSREHRAGGRGPGGRWAGCWRSRRWPLRSPGPPSCRFSRTGAGRRPSTTPGSTSPRAGSSRRSCGRSSSPAPSRSRRRSPGARGAGGPTRGCCCSASGRSPGAALASAGPGLGVIDVRFVPLAQLVAGPGRRGRARPRARAPRPRRRGRAGPRAGGRGARGLELALAAPLGRLELLRAGGEGAVAGLEGADGEARRRAPAPRGWRSSTVPCTSARARSACTRRCPSSPGARGSRASTTSRALTTHPVYYLLSELFPSSPNPFRSRTYSRFDLETGLARLPLLGVDRLVAVSDTLASALDARADVRARGAHTALHALPIGRPLAPLRRAPRLRAGARRAGRVARPGLPLVLAQAAQPRRPRLHRRPALRRRGGRPLGAPARAAVARRERR